MSDQKNAYLKAMDIGVWVERTPSIPELVQPISHVDSEVKLIESESVSIPKSEEVKVQTEVVAKVSVEQLDWPALQSVVTDCNKCELSNNRKKSIFGTGNQTASLMIIGDAPNTDDELQGKPFSGKAGTLLTAMLKAMGYQRNEVYISNLVKCKTSENQDPSIDEVTTCESYLLRQIKLVQPDLILVLGGIAAQRLLKSKSTLSRLRGQLHYIDNVSTPIIVSFDPAYLLRSPNEKRKAWDDLQAAMKELSNIETTNIETTNKSTSTISTSKISKD